MGSKVSVSGHMTDVASATLEHFLTFPAHSFDCLWFNISYMSIKFHLSKTSYAAVRYEVYLTPLLYVNLYNEKYIY
jgi:hypothetical protein